MNLNWKVIVRCLFLLLPWGAKGQIDTTQMGLSLNGGLDLASRFIWRGRDYGQSPAIQPWMEVSYRNFTLGAWGSYRMAGPGIQETDLYLNKSFGNFSVSVWDYYNFSDTLTGNYFDYKEATTGHLFELQAAWNSSWNQNSLNVLMGWFFAGYDKDRSYYIETQWIRELTENNAAGFILGFTPKSGYYAKRAAIVNAGVFYLKKLKFAEGFTVPLNLSLVLNPEEKQFYFLALISL